MTNNDLDELIDSVARQMTDVPTPAYLQTRVLAQLDERTKSPWIWRPVTVAAMVALLVIAAVVVRRPEPPGSSIGETSPVVAPAALASATSPTSPTEQASVVRSPGTGTAGPRPTRLASVRSTERAPAHTVAGDDELAWRERAIPALDHPESVSLAGIQPKPLEIRPLNTAPLTVAPMGEDINRH